eukprot:gene7206-12881_t
MEVEGVSMKPIELPGENSGTDAETNAAKPAETAVGTPMEMKTESTWNASAISPVCAEEMAYHGHNETEESPDVRKW